MSQILLDPLSRARLATWLQHKSKPPNVEPLIWNLLKMGKLASVPFSVLGEISDWDGTGWMKILRMSHHQQVEFDGYLR